MDQLDSVMQAIGSNSDTYISQSSFVRPRRRIIDLSDIGSAWVDIDCYKMGQQATHEFAMSLIERANWYAIPKPSYIMYSGRGIYLKWLFTNAIPATEIHRWNAMQDVLTGLYHAIGADMASRDAVRVLRVVGSTNSTADSQVRPAWESDKRYSFQELAEATSCVDLPEIKGITTRVIRTIQARVKKLQNLDPSTQAASDLQSKIGIARLGEFSDLRQPIMMPKMSLMQLNWQRFIDLRDLSIMRGGITRGSRDLSLFWMSTFLAHSGIITPQNFESEVQALASCAHGEDFNPIADQSLSSLFERLQAARRGEKVTYKGQTYSSLYTPTNDRLIDIFEITDQEQVALSTIIDSSEKLRRADEKVPGRKCRREARVTWRTQVHELAAKAVAEGKTPSATEIAKQVDVHKTQVSRLLNNKIGQPRKQRVRKARSNDQGHKHHGPIIGLRAAMGQGGKPVDRNPDEPRPAFEAMPCAVRYPSNPSDPFGFQRKSQALRKSQDAPPATDTTQSAVPPACTAPADLLQTSSAKESTQQVSGFEISRHAAPTPSNNPAVAVFPLSSKEDTGIGGVGQSNGKGSLNCRRPPYVAESLTFGPISGPIQSDTTPHDRTQQQGLLKSTTGFWPARSSSANRQYPLHGASDLRAVASTIVSKAPFAWPMRPKASKPPRPNALPQNTVKFEAAPRDLSSLGLQYIETLDEAERDAEMNRLMEEARLSDQKFKAEIAQAKAHEESLRRHESSKRLAELLAKANAARELARSQRSAQMARSVPAI